MIRSSASPAGGADDERIGGERAGRADAAVNIASSSAILSVPWTKSVIASTLPPPSAVVNAKVSAPPQPVQGVGAAARRRARWRRHCR